MIYLLTQSSIIFINIDLFIDTIINHIQKWESHTFILEPLFEPDQLTINSSVYIPTIRHVILCTTCKDENINKLSKCPTCREPFSSCYKTY